MASSPVRLFIAEYKSYRAKITINGKIDVELVYTQAKWLTSAQFALEPKDFTARFALELKMTSARFTLEPNV